MERYEYQFIAVPAQSGLKVKPGDTFEACKDIIQTKAAEGWRLKQVVTPFNEKMGVGGALGYQLIFERLAP